jgi:hypothetical protein
MAQGMKTHVLIFWFTMVGAVAAQVESLPPQPRSGPAPVPTNPLTVQPPPALPGTLSEPFAPLPEFGVPDDDEGWFIADELIIAFPFLSDRLPATAPFQVPQAKLRTAVGFHTEVGYRFPEDEGLVALNYRLLNSDGTGDIFQDGMTFTTRTRVATNVIDLDYGYAPYEFAPRYTVSWRMGARLASIYFDSRGAQGNYVRQASNYYVGSGFHGRMDLERRLAVVPGLSLFSRADGGFLIGFSQQRYRDEVPGFTATLTDRDQRNMPMINAQLGLTYRPPSIRGLKFTLGYSYEQWFRTGSLGLGATGQIATQDGSFWWHGPFLHGQFDF